MSSTEKKASKTFSDNPLWNLLLNVVVPVALLKKGASFLPLSALTLLMMALAIPIVVGLWDYLTAKRKNYVSILGVVNTALTGGFALMALDGFWFAVKEGTLPLCFGVFTLWSLRFKKNLVETFFLQPQLINVELVERKSKELGREALVRKITRIGTFWFSLSFFLSAAMNFILGLVIFKPISTALAPEARAQVLNDQIAQMTWMGYVVIALPLTFGTGYLIWWLLKSLSASLDVKMEQLLHQQGGKIKAPLAVDTPEPEESSKPPV